MTGDGFVEEFYTDQFLGWSFGLLSGQCFLTDEFCLVELHKHTQTSHDWRDFLRELIAIERQSHLKTQGIATTKSTCLNTSGNQFIPTGTDEVVGTIHLETVFTRIARAGDESLPNGLAGIKCQVLTRQTEHTLHDIL